MCFKRRVNFLPSSRREGVGVRTTARITGPLWQVVVTVGTFVFRLDRNGTDLDGEVKTSQGNHGILGCSAIDDSVDGIEECE